MYNFLRNASQKQQQMFYHRNHRNLPFLCHPFRAHHSMKINNNAKCCLLFDNMANKKCILIQSRGLRFKVSISSISENTSSNSNIDTDEKNDTESSRINPQQLLSKFESKFAAEHKFTYPISNILPREFCDWIGHKKFLDEFNKENTKSGYKIEWDGEGFIGLPMIFMFLWAVDKFFNYLSPGDVKPEHAKIVAQTPITFDQFVQNYLPSGEVDKIIYYPMRKLFVALIQPGAVINGEPFTGPGLHVQLDFSFNVFPMWLFLLKRRVRSAEERIGLKNPTTFIRAKVIPSSNSIVDILPVISCIGIYYILYKILRKQFWRVVPIKSKNGIKKKGK